MAEIFSDRVQKLFEQLKKDAELSGYHLNTDEEFTKELVKALIVNEDRYGYQACPCRLSSGKKQDDLDIICPCDYRDPDLTDYGSCFCALYVSEKVIKEKIPLKSIPERRPLKTEREKMNLSHKPAAVSTLPLPVWRCKVCGYLCAREQPPEICPVCKAHKDRFERFI
jgi:ferredoxin-thioredoxin reductase catalytic subunit